MPTSGETLKSPSTPTAAKLWWGEQWQDDKAIADAEGVISPPGWQCKWWKALGSGWELAGVYVPMC